MLPKKVFLFLSLIFTIIAVSSYINYFNGQKNSLINAIVMTFSAGATFYIYKKPNNNWR